MWVQTGSLGGFEEPLFSQESEQGPQSEMGRLGRDWTKHQPGPERLLFTALLKKKTRQFSIIVQCEELFLPPTLQIVFKT